MVSRDFGKHGDTCMHIKGTTGVPDPHRMEVISSMKRAFTLIITAALLLAVMAIPSFSKEYKIAIVFDIGGLGDKSFNDSAYLGLQRVAKELGAKTKYAESRTPSDYEPNLAAFAKEGYDMVWGIGFLMADAIEKVSAQYPNTKFGIIDNSWDDAWYKAHPNVMSVMYKENEGSFLMGVLAAMTTKSKVIGFIGGMEFPVIWRFEAGFKAGVEAVDKSIKLLRNYAGSFNDPAAGKAIAVSMIRQKADVIYHASGGTGIGMFEAANETKNVWVIGVDSDQFDLSPKWTLSSMIKRVDNGVFMGTKNLIDGKFKAGVTNLGLKEAGVGMAATTSKNTAAGAIAKANAWASMIIAGQKSVPDGMNEADRISTK